MCSFVLAEGDIPDPGSSLEGRNLSELIIKNYELNLLAFYTAVISLNLILLAVKLVSLDLSVDSTMFIDFFLNFSPVIIYAYPFVLLNPVELKATLAKERIVFLLFILIQFILYKPKTCQSTSLQG